jgi:hypothetical protein
MLVIAKVTYLFSQELHFHFSFRKLYWWGLVDYVEKTGHWGIQAF